MNHRATGLVLFLLVVVTGGTIYAQDSTGAGRKRPRTPDDYFPRTIQEVALEEPDTDMMGDMSETMKIYGDIRPSRVRVIFADSTRSFPANRKEILRQWAMRYAGFPEGYTEPYQQEILVTENGVEHWMAVRENGLAAIKESLKAGGSVDLYLIRVGSALEEGLWAPILLVESYEPRE
jgi:hypothetical protein